MGTYLSTLLSTITARHTSQNPTYHDLQPFLPPPLDPSNEKSPLITTAPTQKTDAQLADEFTALLLSSRTPPAFRAHLSVCFPPPLRHGDLNSASWTESLAEAILHAITAAVEAGVLLGAAKEVVAVARRDVEGWVGEHPVLAGCVGMIVALGVLVVVAPWVVEGLGFGSLGVRLGSFAARWQKMYGGATPGGSLFAFLQRMGMVGW